MADAGQASHTRRSDANNVTELLATERIAQTSALSLRCNVQMPRRSGSGVGITWPPPRRTAGVLLATPPGRAFVEDPATATAVAQIRENLADLEERMASRRSRYLVSRSIASTSGLARELAEGRDQLIESPGHRAVPRARKARSRGPVVFEQGALLVALGQFARAHQRLSGTLPATPGWVPVAAVATGAMIAPASGLWVYHALGSPRVSELTRMNTEVLCRLRNGWRVTSAWAFRTLPFKLSPRRPSFHLPTSIQFKSARHLQYARISGVCARRRCGSSAPQC